MNLKSKKSKLSNDHNTGSSTRNKHSKNHYKSSRTKSRNKTKNLRKRTHSSLMATSSSSSSSSSSSCAKSSLKIEENNHSHNNLNNNNNIYKTTSKYSNLSRSHISKAHNKKKRIHIRRRGNKTTSTTTHTTTTTTTATATATHSDCGTSTVSKEKIIQYRKNLYSDDISRQLDAVSKLRILLSDEQQPPIELVIRSKCVPRLIEILARRESINLLFETAWVLTNICSGSHEHTMAVVEANGIECILNLLDLSDIAVLEQSIWVLGNIAGDGTAARDICLDKGVLTRLINLAQDNNSNNNSNNNNDNNNNNNNNNNNITNNFNCKEMPLSFQRNFVWTISNLVRGKPQPSWNKVSCVIPIILLYLNCIDIEVLTDTCWALSYLSDGCNEHIQSILDLSLLSSIDISAYLVKFLEKKSMNVLVPALRTCGNIVSGSDHQTQQIIDRGLLSKLSRLLRHPNHSVKKEAIWTVSNITAGNPQQIQSVIDHQLIEPLVEILTDYHADHDLVKECIWAISNATTGGTENQLRYLSQYASIGLSRVMSHFPCDKKLQLVLLEGLDNLLSFTNQNPIPLSSSPLANMLTITMNTMNGMDMDLDIDIMDIPTINCNMNININCNMNCNMKYIYDNYTSATSINQETEQYIKNKQKESNDEIECDEYKNIEIEINDDVLYSDIYATADDDDEEYMISGDDPINQNQNYVAYIMEQTEAHRILEKWFYDDHQDRDVAHLAHDIYKKYFNVPYQF